MKTVLKSLIINNFRLFSAKSFNFSEKMNIIVGENATGKTSLLEAINILGVTKSFRTHEDKEILKRNEPFYFVKGSFICGDEETNVVISYTNKGKKITLNGVVLKTLSSYIGKIKVLAFSPDDLLIVKGEPKNKRNYLNQNIGMIEKEYLKLIILYNKILKERNEILKNIEKFDQARNLLNVYTIKIIDIAKKIIIYRKKYIDKISKYANEHLKKISSSTEELIIKYKPSIDVEELEVKMQANILNDIESKNTYFGPHKDSFDILINEYDVCSYGSQGQQKSVAIALKLAITDLIKEKNEEAIIVLDDVFGELDIKRQEELIKSLKDKGQVFISTTDISLITQGVIKESKIIKMDVGE